MAINQRIVITDNISLLNTLKSLSDISKVPLGFLGHTIADS